MLFERATWWWWWWWWCRLHYACVPRKRLPFYFFVSNSTNNHPILTIFTCADVAYTPVGQKTAHLILAHNFGKCWPIFKSLSPRDWAVRWGVMGTLATVSLHIYCWVRRWKNFEMSYLAKLWARVGCAVTFDSRGIITLPFVLWLLLNGK